MTFSLVRLGREVRSLFSKASISVFHVIFYDAAPLAAVTTSSHEAFVVSLSSVLSGTAAPVAPLLTSQSRWLGKT